jgi:uncharacterized protein (TIGR02246 family)
MKMRLLSALAGLAIGLAVPTLAQEKNMVAPEVRQQIEAALMKYEEAYNKYDAAAVAAFYTQDAIEVVTFESAGGVAIGKQAIEKRSASTLASSPRKLSHSLLQVYTIGNDICAISDLSHHYITQKGSYVAIYVREADDWKIRMAYAN